MRKNAAQEANAVLEAREAELSELTEDGRPLGWRGHSSAERLSQ